MEGGREEGGEGDTAVGGGGAGFRHLYSSLISGAGRKVERHGSRAQREIWQNCDRGAGIIDATLQTSASLLGLNRRGDAETHNGNGSEKHTRESLSR